jgi:hypothetical protein
MDLVREFVSNFIIAGPMMYAGIAIALDPERTSRRVVDSIARVHAFQEQFRPGLRRRQVADAAALTAGVRLAAIVLTTWTFARLAGISPLVR